MGWAAGDGCGYATDTVGMASDCVCCCSAERASMWGQIPIPKAVATIATAGRRRRQVLAAPERSASFSVVIWILRSARLVAGVGRNGCGQGCTALPEPGVYGAEDDGHEQQGGRCPEHQTADYGATQRGVLLASI